MAKDEIRRMALSMLADYDARTPGKMFSRPVDLTIPQSYELQNEIARLREERGEKIIGYKIGCTSKSIQEQLGVAEPIFGRIFDTGCFRSGVRLIHERYANLAVEAELAVRVSRDLPGVSLSDDEILEAVAAVFPVIELHHYVLRSSRPSCLELIANNGMHAGFVLADEEVGYPGLPQSAGGLSIRINGTVVGAAAQPWTMGSSVKSLRWLAARLADFGLRLERGQTILTGSPMKLYPVTPGSKIVVEAPALGMSRAEDRPLVNEMKGGQVCPMMALSCSSICRRPMRPCC
jgi:2-keto-4-pentenoate hydratase